MKVTGTMSTRGGSDAARRPLPAPPVPPRPSKALVAEALARTRALTHDAAAPAPAVTPRPTPPPPPPVNRSHSETLLNVMKTSDNHVVEESHGRSERYDLSPRTLNDLHVHVNTSREDSLDNSHYSSITPTTILMIDNSSSPKPVSPTLSPRNAIPLVQDLVTELRECSQLRSHSDHVDKQENDYSILTLAKKSIVKTCIQHSDWFQVEDGGHPIRYSSCQITLEDPPGVYSSEQSPNLGLPYRNYQSQPNHTNSSKSPFYFNKRRERMASLQGLPPLPKSLSGMNLLEGAVLSSAPEVETPTRASSRPVPPVPGARAGTSRTPTSRPPPQSPGPGGDATPRPRKPTGLDAQLAVLRTEMFGLRQLDLSLLAQLWSLNESIQEFRQLLQEQDTLSPPSPSSADDGDEFYHYLTSVPEQYCLSSSSSQSSIEYGNV